MIWGEEALCFLQCEGGPAVYRTGAVCVDADRANLAAGAPLAAEPETDRSLMEIKKELQVINTLNVDRTVKTNRALHLSQSCERALSENKFQLSLR